MAAFPIYFDYHATTPCDPRVVEFMLPYFSEHFGNASSKHHPYGWQAEEAVTVAREQVAGLIGAEPGEVIFTSGATESINLALRGVTGAYGRKGNHIITFETEHKAVLECCQQLEKSGARISYIPVDAKGNPDLSRLEAEITPETLMIAAMYANNETGVLFPVQQLSALARKHGVLFFCDATQAVGKVPVNMQEDGIDLLALSAHKFYGPKGVGALYLRRRDPRVTIHPQISGGGQEKGLRGGTLNVPGIAGMGKAAAIILEEGYATASLSKLRNRLEQGLLNQQQVFINGDAANRLPTVTNLRFEGIQPKALLQGITRKIAVSSGSACTSALPKPSHVLKAMGLSDAAADSSIRFSLGRFSTADEVDRALEEIIPLMGELRKSFQQV